MTSHVRPLADAGGGNVLVNHHAQDGSDHAGTVAAQLPAAGDRSAIRLDCPGCTANSVWPVTGGAEPSLAPLLVAVAGQVP